MSEQCGHIEKPSTLKKALDLLCHIKDSGIWIQIAGKLNEKISACINNIKVIDITGDFNNVLEKACELRSGILKYPNSGGDYAKFNQCESCCLEIFLNLVPKLQTTLSYIYFQLNPGLTGYDDGQWNGMRCDGIAIDGNSNYLNNWLVSTNPAVSATRSQAKLLPGGFKNDELSDKTGDFLMSSVQDLVDAYDGEGFILALMLKLSVATEFTHESTAMAMALIKKFCNGIKYGSINAEGYEYSEPMSNIAKICGALAQSLTPVVPDSREFPTSVLSSPFIHCIEQYVFWKGESCKCAVKWITNALPKLITFLKNMKTDCQTCDSDLLQHGHIAGPLPYGFFFGGLWKTDGSYYTSNELLPEAIEKLVGSSSSDGSLLSLLKCLNPRAKIAEYEQSQHETSAATPSSAAASGMSASSVMPSGGFVASGAADVQTGRPDTHSSGGGGGGGIGVDDGKATHLATKGENAEIVTPRDGEVTATVETQTGAGGGSSHVTSNQRNEAKISGRTLQSQPMLAQPGSSDGFNDSSQSGAGTPNDGDSGSTITIGGAAGGAALLGGGGAALYFLNVGGIRTLITGVQ
ncbi:EGF-containing fibulin-like extracellular matrix protein 1 [Babesia caballi]|uniref:EGF-containing fibulin-like extracellular matrix protein 1 n=1 Tax=Babesia caballi TaxID=5871 RepID=A0AAV4M0T1_BABCB|nr:EGF-containing fibulin-like extracellular matrix protein 1 [Babesia caballi]